MSGTQKLLAALITALALIALGASSYLSWVTWQQSTVAGCTGGSEAGCDEVLASKGSRWLGVPVSFLGVLTYVAILAAVWPAAAWGGWLMTGLLTLAMMAVGAGAWFTVSQAFIVKHFCMYCMTVHLCGLAICTLTILLFRAAARPDGYDPMKSFFAAEDFVQSEATNANLLQPVIASVVASVGLAALVGGQVFFAPSGMEIVDIPVQIAGEAIDPEQIVPSAGFTGRVEADAPAMAQGGSDPLLDNQPPSGQSQRSGEIAEEMDVMVPVERPTAADDVEQGEPVGEAVIASDEPEPTQESSEAPTPSAATDTQNRSFEELFGASPEDTLLTPTPTTPVPRVFRYKYLKGDIDVENNPVLGNPYARVRMVELLDYTCPHCRKMHSLIKKSVERYGSQLGIVLYHVPLSRKCNQLVKIDQVSHANACDLVRLAFGVWKLAPEKFYEFHDWLMTGDKAPPLHEAKSRAIALAGLEVLTDKSIDVDSKRRVAEHAADMEALQVGLPVLIFEDGVIKGMPNSDAEWFQMLEQRLGLKAPTTRATN